MTRDAARVATVVRIVCALVVLAVCPATLQCSSSGTGDFQVYLADSGAASMNDGSAPDTASSANDSSTPPPPPTEAGGGDVMTSTPDSSPMQGDSSMQQQGDAGHPPCKRGVAGGPPSAALAPTASAPGVVWWYNWGSQGSSMGTPIEFVPMIWGSNNLGDTLPAGSQFVLGFNEPNFTSQANLSPQQAAADWPQVEALAQAAGGIPLVSPAVNYCGGCTVPSITDPYTYLSDFFQACTGCEVDYVAVHWYNCDLPSLQSYIMGNGADMPGFLHFGKPIWLTEFSCDGSASVAQQKAYMQAAIPWLESNQYIYRYSWFSASPIPNAELVNPDGSLTDLGTTYVNLPASCQ
jgi:hypothetical protein